MTRSYSPLKISHEFSLRTTFPSRLPDSQWFSSTFCFVLSLRHQTWSQPSAIFLRSLTPLISSTIPFFVNHSHYHCHLWEWVEEEGLRLSHGLSPNWSFWGIMFFSKLAFHLIPLIFFLNEETEPQDLVSSVQWLKMCFQSILTACWLWSWESCLICLSFSFFISNPIRRLIGATFNTKWNNIYIESMCNI